MSDKNITLNEMITPDNDNISDRDFISLIAVNELVNSKNTKRISRILPEQVNILTKLYLFADVFGTTLTRDLADNILDLQISIKGLGRRELVQLVQQREDLPVNVPYKSKDIFR